MDEQTIRETNEHKQIIWAMNKQLLNLMTFNNKNFVINFY